MRLIILGQAASDLDLNNFAGGAKSLILLRVHTQTIA